MHLPDILDTDLGLYPKFFSWNSIALLQPDKDYL